MGTPITAENRQNCKNPMRGRDSDRDHYLNPFVVYLRNLFLKEYELLCKHIHY